MRRIVIGRKYWMTTKHGVKVLVVAKQANESSGSAMGFVRVELESNGIEIHVKRRSLREVNIIETNRGKKIRYIGFAVLGVVLILLIQSL